ncbi:hypothetical protein K4K57_008434 [Colletotrichum sp. SAR 10_99]|nr:hypothetical protein K4K57_008434 [Colletotrichum sp. SAR 10_99]
MARTALAQASPIARDITSCKIPEGEEMQIQIDRIAASHRGTQFEKRVWTALCQVPTGHITTYALLANHLKSSPRAVGNALRRNPYAPQVPCHRVIATGGDLGGFKGKQPKNAGMRFETILTISLLTSATAAVTLPRRDATFESGTPVTKEITLLDGHTRTATFFAEFTPEDSADAPAPISRNLNAKRGWTPSSSFYDLCGGSSFTNNWNSNAPLVDDCQFLQQYFASTGGYFRVENSDLNANGVSWSRLVSINTCGFSVRANPRPATAGYIGNTDVADLNPEHLRQARTSEVKMKLTAAFASLLATLAAAAPTPQEDDPAVVFGISFTYENGTFTDLFDVPETLSGYPVAAAS